MADLSSTPPAGQSESNMSSPGEGLNEGAPGDLVYRPLSGLALAGFVLGSLFAGLVVLSTVVGFIQGVPFFLPPWAIALACVGAVLSMLGLRHVSNSEGTRAGAGLARWGLGLSVVLGLCYVAYSTITGMALRVQANDFLMVVSEDDSGFFPRLLKGNTDPVEHNRAFLLCVPSTNRGGSRPENEDRMRLQYDSNPDGTSGALTAFRQHSLIRALKQAGPDTKIEVLGTQDWKPDKGGYQVSRNYRIHTPEAVLDVLLVVQSTEGVEGDPRRWFLMLPNSVLSNIKLTPLGEGLAAYRSMAKKGIEHWVADLNSGKAFTAFNEKNTVWSKLLPKAFYGELIRKNLVESFASTEKNRLQIQPGMEEITLGAWKQVDGRLQFPLSVKMPITVVKGQQPAFTLDGEVVLRSKSRVDPSQPTFPPPEWEAVDFIVTRASPIPGPGMPKN